MGCGKSIAVSVEGKAQQPQPKPSLNNPSPDETSNDDSLSDIQAEMIKSTWPLVAQDLTANGVSIFLDIFAAEPAVRQFFSFSFSNIQNGKSEKNIQLEAHSTKFMQTINMVCESLPNLEVDCPASQKLMVLGAQHAIIDGFDVMYFSTFTKCLHLTWEKVLGEEYTEEVKEAWTLLFEFIMERIIDGYIVFNSEHKKEGN